MKRILLLALYCFTCYFSALHAGMGAPGAPIPTNLGGAELQRRTLEALRAAKGLVSNPIPEKYRTPLAIGSLATLAGWAAWQTSQRRALEAEQARSQEAARLLAEKRKQKIIAGQIEAAKRDFDPLIANKSFPEKYAGGGFNGWFYSQQRSITKLIESPELRNEALNPSGALAATDQFRYFGYRPREGAQEYYIFTVNTIKSIKTTLRQNPAILTQPETPTPVPPLQGQALIDATARLNPRLVITLRKINDDGPITTHDNLEFAFTNQTENPYAITIYEEPAPVAPKLGWFASWFRGTSSTESPQQTLPASAELPPSPAETSGSTVPVEQTPTSQIPTGSSEGIMHRTPSTSEAEATTAGYCLLPRQEAAAASSSQQQPEPAQQIERPPREQILQQRQSQ